MARDILPLLDTRGHRCTDVICCVFFLLACATLVPVAVFSAKNGKTQVLRQVVIGTDSHGQECGLGKARHYPLAYLTLPPGFKVEQYGNWSKSDLSALKIVCTTKCPTKRGDELKLSNRDRSDCYTPSECTWYGGNTRRIANYCVDTNLFQANAGVHHWISDLRASWRQLCAVPIVAIMIGFGFLAFIKQCGGMIVLICIMCSVCVPLMIASFLFITAKPSDPSQYGHRNLFGSPENQQYVAYSLWSLSGLVAVVCCCYQRTIRDMIDIVHSTSSFLIDVKSQMVQPVFFGVCYYIFFVVWLSVFVLASTVGAEPASEADRKACLEDGQLYCFKWTSSMRIYLAVWLLFLLYWVLGFFVALSHYGTSFAVGKWYFAPTDPITGRRTILQGHSCFDCRLTWSSVWRGFAWHTGSLAFGACTIAIAKVVQVLFSWVRKEAVDASGGNPVVRCLSCLMGCLVACFERLIEFISEHAYVEVALQGEGFCTSAHRAFVMAVERPFLFALSSRIANFLRFLGVLNICGGTTAAVFGLLVWYRPSSLSSYTAPLITTVVAALVIAEVMTHPFTTTVRAMLHCFVLDERRVESLGAAVPQHPAPHAVPTIQFLVQRMSDSHTSQTWTGASRRGFAET